MLEEWFDVEKTEQIQRLELGQQHKVIEVQLDVSMPQIKGRMLESHSRVRIWNCEVLTLEIRDRKRILMGLLLNVGQSKQAFLLDHLVFCWHCHILHIYFVKGEVSNRLDFLTVFQLGGENAQTNQNRFNGKQWRKKKEKKRTWFWSHVTKRNQWIFE